MTSKVLSWQSFSLMKSCKCQNLNYLFREISFLELPKYSQNVQILTIIEKFKNWKIPLKNSWKIGTPFGRRSWKSDTPLVRLLARWNVKMRVWQSFGTLTRRPRWHAWYAIKQTPIRFVKVLMWPWKLQLTFKIWRTYVTSWSKGSLSRCGLLDIFCVSGEK